MQTQISYSIGMRIIMTSLLTLSLTATAALGQLKVPRKSFPIGELEAAKASAAEQNKPLIFVDT